MTCRLIWKFWVGACLKSTRHRYVPWSWSLKSSIHSKGKGWAFSSNLARAPKLPSFQWRPISAPWPPLTSKLKIKWWDILISKYISTYMVSKIFDKITKCAYFGQGIARLRKLSYPIWPWKPKKNCLNVGFKKFKSIFLRHILFMKTTVFIFFPHFFLAHLWFFWWKLQNK